MAFPNLWNLDHGDGSGLFWVKKTSTCKGELGHEAGEVVADLPHDGTQLGSSPLSRKDPRCVPRTSPSERCFFSLVD